MKRNLTLIFLLFCTFFAQAQPITVAGKVADEEGKPIAGATLWVEGEKAKTTTNREGFYTIQVASGNSLLEVAADGYEPFMVMVGEQRTFNFTLKTKVEELGEVVVVAVGYGKIKRENLTGSVSSTSYEQIKDIPVTSLAQAIAGKMPGVVITQSEGDVDADMKIRIRGGGSVTQDNSPLFIVDGFPTDDIKDIPTADISAIDVLKDASSTAIYGARGANGVIVITTKQGVVGRARVSYNAYFGIRELTKTLDVLSPYEYALWQYEILDNYAYFFGDFRDMGIYKTVSGTSWQREILGNTGTNSYHNLSVSGGTKDMKYNFYVTRDDVKDIMLNSRMGRTSVGAKTDFQLKPWLRMDLNFKLYNTTIHGTGTAANSRMAHILQFRPFREKIHQFVEDDQDDEESSVNLVNPLYQTLDDYRRSYRRSYVYNAGATIDLSKELNYRLEVGGQYRDDENRIFYGKNTTNAYRYGQQPLASIQHINGQSLRMANVLTYSRKLKNRQNLKLMAGQETNYAHYHSILTSAKYFPQYMDPETALAGMIHGLADPVVTTDPGADKMLSFFGRAEYDYMQKYLISTSMRADASSKFAPGRRWGYFPSVGLAWRASSESFMRSTRKWLSDLKIRVSYGQAGNNRISSDAWRKIFTPSSGTLYMDESPTIIVSPSTVLENPALKWETTTTRVIGTDFALFRNRLRGTAEVYYNTTRDLLIRTSIPSHSGYNTQWQNIGSTSNRGVEFSLDGKIIAKKDFTLSAQFNIGFNRNRVESLGAVDQTIVSTLSGSDGPVGDYIVRVGSPVGLMYGYQTDGMYSFDDFTYDPAAKTYTIKPGVANNKALTGAKYFGPGALKFVNQNPQDGDSVDADNDRVVIGNANPKHTGGFALNAYFKGVDFTAAFNWSYGNDVYNLNKLLFTTYFGGRYYKNLMGMMTSSNRFLNFDPATGAVVRDPDELASLNQHATYWSTSMNRAPLHSWAIEDGSFLRLNNLTIGYTFPKTWVEKIKLQKLRVYFTGYNLWLWTRYTGFDPEVDTIRSTPLTPGVDYNAYPRSRTYNFGLNVTF